MEYNNYICVGLIPQPRSPTKCLWIEKSIKEGQGPQKRRSQLKENNNYIFIDLFIKIFNFSLFICCTDFENCAYVVGSESETTFYLTSCKFDRAEPLSRIRGLWIVATSHISTRPAAQIFTPVDNPTVTAMIEATISRIAG
jgi:hypothetical protein